MWSCLVSVSRFSHIGLKNLPYAILYNIIKNIWIFFFFNESTTKTAKIVLLHLFFIIGFRRYKITDIKC